MNEKTYYQAASVDRYFYDVHFTVREIQWLCEQVSRVWRFNHYPKWSFATNDNHLSNQDRMRIHYEVFLHNLQKLSDWINLRKHYTFRIPQHASFTLAEVEFMTLLVINRMLDEKTPDGEEVPDTLPDKLKELREKILIQVSQTHETRV